MGMFDYLSCEAELPEGAPDIVYQTKDTPAKALEWYTITSDGKLVGPMGQPNPDFRGEVRFYGSTGPAFSSWWEFSALFDGGKLLNIVTVARPSPPEAP